MISLARDTSSPRMGKHTVCWFRVIIALVAFADGLLVKILGREELQAQYASIGVTFGMDPRTVAVIVGILEMIVALVLASGRAFRWCLCLILAGMIVFLFKESGDAKSPITSFITAIIHRTPMIALMVMTWIYGPGTNVLRGHNVRRNTWTRG